MGKSFKGIFEGCKKINSFVPNRSKSQICKSFILAYLAENQSLKSFIGTDKTDITTFFSVANSVFQNGGNSHTYKDFFTENTELSNSLAEYDFLSSIKANIDTQKPDLTVDLLLADNSFSEYEPLLSEGGFLAFEGEINGLTQDFFDNFTSVFSCDGLNIFYKEKDGYKDFVKTDKLKMRLSGVYERVLNREEKALPIIAVGVLAYNQSEFITQCLESIAAQQGEFICKLIIADDNSTDDTNEKIENFIANANRNDRFQIEYIRNETNLGVMANFCKLINLIKKSNCDYFTFCEGDDYYLTANRLASHIEVHLKNPQTAFSYNKLLLYFQDNNSYELHCPDFNAEKITTEILAGENAVGSLCAPFFSADLLNYINDDLFGSMFAGDWMLDIICSQYGDTRHLNLPMSVYRKHSKGCWSGISSLDNLEFINREIDKYNKYLNFTYDPYFQDFRNAILKELRNNGRVKNADIAVIDNVFPQLLSAFSYHEITGILEYFDGAFALPSGVYSSLLSNEPIENLIIDYKRKHPEIADRVYKTTDEILVKPKLLYGIFLTTAHNFILDLAEKMKVPFVFTLYPGGGFVLDDDNVDQMLRNLFSSPRFAKVIVTQQATYDYLLSKGFCKSQDIAYIFGVVTDTSKLNADITAKKRFGIQKDTLDICFVAHRYSKLGEEKGYDLFIEAAKRLNNKYDNIVFHIVGPWDENIIDVSEVKNIVFYGLQKSDWIREFYTGMDIIISANLNGSLAPGAFDGFPTAATTEASLCGVAMFCTDPVKLNQSRFKENEEIVILEHSADDITEKIEYYYNNPQKLAEIGLKGKKRSEAIYSYESQLLPRFAVLQEVLEKYDDFIAEKPIEIEPTEHTEPTEPTPDGSKLKAAIRFITPSIVLRAYRKLKRIIVNFHQI